MNQGRPAASSSLSAQAASCRHPNHLGDRRDAVSDGPLPPPNFGSSGTPTKERDKRRARMMFFQQYVLGCLSQLSYLVGDDSTGRAVVVDPHRDVSVYVQDANERGLRIERVIETHYTPTSSRVTSSSPPSERRSATARARGQTSTSDPWPGTMSPRQRDVRRALGRTKHAAVACADGRSATAGGRDA